MAQRPKIIAVGYFHYGTGLTRVMDVLLSGFAEKFECHLLALGYSGERYEKNGIQIYPTNPNGGDVFAAFQTRDFVETLKPELVFILHDIWMFSNYQRVLAPVRHLAKFAAYIPLDGNIVDESVSTGLHGFDVVGVYTEWAKSQVEDALSRIQAAAEEPLPLPQVEVIGHGVYLNEFRPLPELQNQKFHRTGRTEAKQKVFPELENPETSFVVLNASCPSARKRVPVTIEGFAKFAEGKPENVKLCLHQAITEPDTEDLVSYARERLGSRLIYNPLTPEDGSPLNEEDLNLLYNACDVGINTSAGEGWGLVSFEHAAAGGAQAIPKHSACESLWSEENCTFLQPASRSVPHFSPLEMGFIEPDEVEDVLNRFYQNETLLTQKSREGHLHATQNHMQWDAVVDKWSSVLQDLVKS